MIKDNIKNYKNYLGLSEYLDLGLEYVAKTDFSEMQNGKYEILEDKVYALVQDYNSKPQDEGKFEAHKKYIDIQYIVKGSEQIGFGEISNFYDSDGYNSEKDIMFFNENNGKYDFVKLYENDFAIFYPQDVHMPQISINETDYVKKVVTKIMYE